MRLSECVFFCVACGLVLFFWFVVLCCGVLCCAVLLCACVVLVVVLSCSRCVQGGKFFKDRRRGTKK